MTVAHDDAGKAAAAIHELLTRYFDGLYNSDAELLSGVFHPLATYACATDGSLTHLDMTTYLPMVAKRESPAARHEPRTDAVRSITFAGPVTALAQVECSIGPKHFTDLLSLVHVEGRWQIIAKVFHYDLPDQPSNPTES